MPFKQDDTSRETLLTSEQREYLREHQVRNLVAQALHMCDEHQVAMSKTRSGVEAVCLLR